jgi:Divergent InlB B-repeat domain
VIRNWDSCARCSRRATVALTGLTLVFVGMLAGEARADTRHFVFTGAGKTFTVPAGVTNLHIVAVGGAGGNANGGGGFGARVSANLTVHPGEILHVFVGANGGNGSTDGTAAAFNGGGAGGSPVSPEVNGGGAGGGASDVRTSLALSSRVLVAGGGGGGGAGGIGAGGGGASASSTPSDGGAGGGTGSGSGGHGATTSLGGAGGAGGGPDVGDDGGTGILGAGGAGGSGDMDSTSMDGGDGGGGGGGGYYGGGGGGGSGGPAGGGGGGAGSSYVSPALHNPVVTTGSGNSPSVTFTYTVPRFTLAVRKTGTGKGTVRSQPAGINCGFTCAAKYRDGTLVTLRASPSPGSRFKEWSGPCSGTGPCRVRINARETVTATFTAIHQAADKSVPAVKLGYEAGALSA